MMVDLPEPDGPTSAVTVSGSDWNETSCSTVFAGVVGEVHVIENHLAA